MTTINTTIPYSLEDMRTMITTPDTEIIIDYDNSKLQGTAALIYLTNINLYRPQIKVDDKDRFFQLVDNYVTLKSVLYVETLIYAVASVLLYKAGCFQYMSQQEIDELHSHSSITEQDCADYLADEQRARNINALQTLMESMLLFTLSCSKEFTAAFGDVETYFPVVDNINYTGLTFIHLTGIETFVLNFYSVPVKSLSYFKQQFNEYIYDGKPLFGIISEKQSILIPLLECILKQTITPQLVQQAAGELIEVAA